MASGITLFGHTNLLSPVRDTNGVTVRWYWGKVVRPISYPWGPNPWSECNLFVLRFPATGPFLSVRWGRIVFYMGFKMFSTRPWPDPGQAAWMYPSDGGRTYLTPSVSLRGLRK